jgi:SAM-dependent methyltransferase
MTRSFSPAADRNKGPLLDAMNPLLSPRARVLEIGAGTGQHADYFTQRRSDLDWLATDQEDRVPELDALAAATGSPPRFRVRALTIGKDDWPPGPFDVVYSANTLHIMPWPCSVKLIDGAAVQLKAGGLLICYGPFKDRGRHNADSNRAFDESLRSRDPHMGLRDLVELRALGRSTGLPIIAELDLPANNRLIVFRKS